MEKELMHGIDDVANGLNENIALELNKIQVENASGIPNDLNNIKLNLEKKKHSHTSCKGCDGICCNKKNKENVLPGN